MSSSTSIALPQSDELERRLPWLLVFRGAVATGLLALTLVADIANWQMRLMSVVLYGVVVVSYLVVVALGLMLRSRISPVIISTVHLATTVMAALMVVQATGGVVSGFSFLYLLVILDGAIIGGQRVALAVATAASLAFGAQLALQLYGVFDAGLSEVPPPGRFVYAAFLHVAAFYLVAMLAGRLALLWQSAQQAASSAQLDRDRIEAHQSVVLESLPVGVVTCGAKRIIQSANAAAGRLFGIPQTQLVGQPLVEPLVAFLEGESLFAEQSLTIAGSEVFWSLGRSSVHDDDRELDVVVIEDRTEVQALQKSLRAKERLASVGEMAAAIAHELRNPLAAISGSVELLGSASDSSRERLESIVLREIARLNALVHDFLSYARPNPPSLSPVDLRALVEDVCAVLTRDAQWSGRQLTVDGPQRLEVRVDASQIRQVLWNLLRNALEASPDGRPVEVSMARESGWASLVIRDYGEGIDPKIRMHLFEPFRTTKSKGTGLGLAVVHRIVTAHGGRVDLVEAHGDGCEARVALPTG